MKFLFSKFVKASALTLLAIGQFTVGNLHAGQLLSDSFQFRMPQAAHYYVEATSANALTAQPRAQWLRATRSRGSTNFVEFSSRVVLQLKAAENLNSFLSGHELSLARTIGSNLFILQAPDAMTAVQEAHRLAALDGVALAYPALRHPADMHGPYAVSPSDNLFSMQWPLEHRNADGSSAGPDINARAAWPYSTGLGAIIAVADTGIEMAHPELADRVVGAPHFNFATQTTAAGPVNNSGSAAHGTEVAGLAAAAPNNARMLGVAPGASLASWVIFDTNMNLIADDQLMDVYQYQSNTVSVQNHSWGHSGYSQTGLTPLEDLGISNAVTHGRSGRGVVLVRSCGNDRAIGAGADDDAYPSDPRVIAVAAVRLDGRAASYSEPGACVLVGAPSGDLTESFPGLFTTDLLGTAGVNQLSYCPPTNPNCPNRDLGDYVFNAYAFTGTSAAAPHIAGIVALLLAANPELTYRDVQQILILASRHFDFTDPDLMTNGAGFQVSHNVGFGVPDAGVAVQLALNWLSRPAATQVTFANTNPAAIPDDGLRVEAAGAGVPIALASLHCLPSFGPHADTPTPALRLADFGYGTTNAGFNLTNQGALIQRGATTFSKSITLAAQAGASFAVVYNYATNVGGATGGGDTLVVMNATDYVPIPAVFIGNTDGEALKALFQTNSAALARISLNSTSYVFSVTNTLICEQVGLRVTSDHPIRRDLRITLVSPAGTRSILQHFNADLEPGPVDWTYYSTHHFFESSAGNWTAYFSDEFTGSTGSVLSVSLILNGVPILDTDHDGLDDNWELTYAGNLLAQSAKDDIDHDGYSAAREQIMGTNPTVPNNLPSELGLSLWNNGLARLSWEASPAYTYDILGGSNLNSLTLYTNLPGHFPVSEWFLPYSNRPPQYLHVRAKPN